MDFRISEIKKKYGRKPILEDVTFDVLGGRCVGILGVNGSGKSTLLSILAGVRRADGGSFLCEEGDLLQKSGLRNEYVGYVPQGTPLMEELSARDNLLLWYTRGELKTELESGVLSMLGVADFLDKPVSKLSGGMKKRLSIGCSMACHPRLLLMDEPSAAIDFVCKKNIVDYITAFKYSGGSVIITTHDTSELSVCDDIYLLKDGRLVPYDFDGDVEKLAESLL
ncbi:MAG: ABC transporter ATP-binding protein [Clostridia bacterium]|nr:ABC transporter ATP-binding protein [Clostridia bacterium]